jgi:hypothetical protein
MKKLAAAMHRDWLEERVGSRKRRSPTHGKSDAA